jgi:hypothetical protein
MVDPFTSPAKKKELEEAAARKKKVILFGGVGLLVVVVLAVVGYFTLIAGGTGSDAMSQQDKDVGNMRHINKRLDELNTLIDDKTIGPSEKVSYQKEKKKLEQDRDELMKKRPDLK